MSTVCVYSNTENLIIVVIYRPPDDCTGGHRSTALEFQTAIDKLKDTISDVGQPMPDIIISWPSGIHLSGASKDKQSMLNILLSLRDDLFLTQNISIPTQKDGNVLDLVFTNNSHLCHSYNCIQTLYTFDLTSLYNQNCSRLHCCISKQECHDEVERAPRTRFEELNFFSQKVNWDDINTSLDQQNWITEFKNLTATEMLETFYCICLDIIAKDFVPTKSLSHIIIITIIIFGLTSIFHASMGWTGYING